MPPRDEAPRLQQLAVLACEFSGLNPFHMRNGKPLWQSEEAYRRAREALAILGGVNSQIDLTLRGSWQ